MNENLIAALQKKVAKGAGIAFWGTLLDIIIVFVYSFLLVRMIGAADYGVYALGVSIIRVIGMFSLMGLHFGVIRFFSMYMGEKKYAELKGLLISVFIFILISSMVIGIGFFLCSKVLAITIFKKSELTLVIRVFSLALPLYSGMMVLSFVFQGLHKINIMVFITKIVRPAAMVIAFLVLCVGGLRLYGAVAAFCLGCIMAGGCGLWLLLKAVPVEVLTTPPVYNFKKVLFFSVPLIFLYFAINLMNRLDILMLGYWTDAHYVGVYAIASKIALFNFFPYAAFSTIFGPVFADLYNRKMMAEVAHVFKTTTRWCFTLTVPSVLVICFFSPEIMLIFGKDFIQGSQSIIILSLLWLIVSFSGSIGLILVMGGYQIQELVFSLIALAANIVLNSVLIPQYGIVGAAIATFISLVLFNVTKMLYVYRKFHIHPFSKNFSKPLVAAMVAGFILLLGQQLNIHNNVVASMVIIVLFFIAYVFTLVRQGLPDADAMVLQAVVRKVFFKKEP